MVDTPLLAPTSAAAIPGRDTSVVQFLAKGMCFIVNVSNKCSLVERPHFTVYSQDTLFSSGWSARGPRNVVDAIVPSTFGTPVYR